MPRPLLSTDTILDAAFELLQEKGAQAVNARALSARLRCSTKTLYQQVGNREQLIRALVARAFTYMDLVVEPGPTWQATASGWARALREVLTSNRELARLMTFEDRSVVVDYVNRLIRVLMTQGVPSKQAADIASVLVSVTLRMTLSEVGEPEPPARDVYALALEWLIAGMSADVLVTG